MMNIEELTAYCLSLPHVTQDIKWENDLCFCIGAKIFCVTGLDGPFGVSFKVTDDEFEELSVTPGIIPAPYMARYKWIYINDASRFTIIEWKHYIQQSYNLVKAKLPKSVLAKLN